MSTIFAPVVAMIALIGLLWIWMMYKRLSYLFRARIHPQKLADPAQAERLLEPEEISSESFSNQFEIPVVFLFGAIVAHQVGAADGTTIALSWFFVATRAVHAIVHNTFNVVRVRFAVYALGTFACGVIWWRVGMRVLSL